MELPEIVTDVGLSEQVKPIPGEMDDERLTVPGNPARLETEIVEDPGDPATATMNEGDAEIPKSCIA